MRTLRVPLPTALTTGHGHRTQRKCALFSVGFRLSFGFLLHEQMAKVSIQFSIGACSKCIVYFNISAVLFTFSYQNSCCINIEGAFALLLFFRADCDLHTKWTHFHMPRPPATTVNGSRVWNLRELLVRWRWQIDLMEEVRWKSAAIRGVNR